MLCPQTASKYRATYLVEEAWNLTRWADSVGRRTRERATRWRRHFGTEGMVRANVASLGEQRASDRIGFPGGGQLISRSGGGKRRRSAKSLKQPLGAPQVFLCRPWLYLSGSLAIPFVVFRTSPIREMFTARAVMPMFGFAQSHKELRVCATWPKTCRKCLIFAVFLPLFPRYI